MTDTTIARIAEKAQMSFADIIKRLEESELWSITEVDWELSIHHCLTEPTCPSVRINPEGWNITRYSHHADTAEDALRRCVDHVRREVLERQLVGVESPFTNSHDGHYEKWIQARCKGSNDPLPRPPQDTRRTRPSILKEHEEKGKR